MMAAWLLGVLLVSWWFNYGAALPLRVEISKAPMICWGGGCPYQ